MSNPLDATTFLTKPCSVLRPEQLQALSLPGPGQPATGAIAKAVGPSCTWINSDAGDAVTVGFVTGNQNGLADLYGMHQRGAFKGYWIETTVDGYPGIFHDEHDRRSSGQCNLATGISNTLVLQALESGLLKDVQKSCDRTKQIALAAVQALKIGG